MNFTRMASFSTHKVFHQDRRMLEWRSWQWLAFGTDVRLHSVCRTGAGRRMKIGDGAMV